jgi:hypothetical protein
MPTTPNLPKDPPCWINFAGWTEIRVSEHLLRARWNAELYDVAGVPPSTIISITDPFEVCFRVELSGDLWRCVCGTWCFDLCFDPCGAGAGFNLSKRLPADVLHVKDWKGCDTRCIEKCYTVPAGTITADECTILYEVGATFQLYCCERPAPVVGHEVLGTYQFYNPGP